MLRELERLLRPGGRLAFTTIWIARGLTPAEHRRARRVGPRAVASRSDQLSLLTHAGFVDIDELDLTAEFECTARAWLTGSEANAGELAVLQPDGAFEQGVRERRALLRAIEDGLLRRGLFSAGRRATRRR